MCSRQNVGRYLPSLLEVRRVSERRISKNTGEDPRGQEKRDVDKEYVEHLGTIIQNCAEGRWEGHFLSLDGLAGELDIAASSQLVVSGGWI